MVDLHEGREPDGNEEQLSDVGNENKAQDVLPAKFILAKTLPQRPP